jgi:nucleoside-diphosphate-sugar epimerase
MPFTRSFKPFSLLLSGAPGWLCDAMLSQLGDALPALTRVRCLIQTGTAQEHIDEWRARQPSVTEIAVGDLLDPASLTTAFEQMSGGVVFHAAGVFQPKKISEYYAVNRDGTTTLATLAKQAGVRRFVYISSTAAQGAARSANHILTESMPCKPYSHYGKSKLAAEQALLKLHHPGTFDVVILRPGPFYGPPVPPHHIELFKRLKQGRASLIGGGKYTRSWSFIDDVANAAIACLTHSAAVGEIFNVCDSQAYLQRTIFEAIADALDIKLRFRRVPSVAASIAQLTGKLRARYDHYDTFIHLMSDENRHMGVSSEKAQRLLGLEPQATPHNGLAAAVEWCRDHALIDF